MSNLYPLLFKPVLKDYIWGGRNLEGLYGRQLPPGPVAESWDVAAHAAGDVVVANGRYTGVSLSRLCEDLGVDLVGRNSAWASERGKFPLLVKLLDAQERLSVQVHPNDEYALANENNELGKTEMWVVLHAEPGAELILGVTKGTTPKRFRAAIAAAGLEQHLHRIPVQSGDFVCVPSGSLHAILGGLVIAEIQQNSDLTYRVYDWGREAPGRALHIEQSMAVINFDQVEPKLPVPLLVVEQFRKGIRLERLCDNRYFTVERWTMTRGSNYEGSCDGSTFEIWGTISGQVNLTGSSKRLTLPAITFTLLPAAMGGFELVAKEPSTVLRAYVGPVS